MIRAIAAILSIISFIAYQFWRISYGYDLSELYFIALSLTTSAFCFLSLRKKDNIFVNSLVILCGSFFGATVIIYVYRWVIFGDGSNNYYTALCFSAIATLIFTIIDTIYGRNR